MGRSRGTPRVGTFNGLEKFTGGSYGKQLKEDARRYYGSFMSYAGRCEMVPNDDCFTEIDNRVKDKWGIPVLKFHWKWSDYEIRQAAHMHKTFAELITEMVGAVTSEIDTNGKKAILPGGMIIHEVGGTIMGENAKSSVTNQYNQTWDVKNLFITDGGPFCSNADKNPTLTIMAFAWRSADYMMDAMKKGDL